MEPSLRERRRATATREILDAARGQIAESGPAALAMRSVARALGMTVQALYHYFPSRDDLITALISEAYQELGDAVEAALDAPGDRPRFVVAAAGYRAWALEHRGLFELLYGTPLINYTAPSNGVTTDAARRLGLIFVRELFGAYTEKQLASLDLPPLGPAMRASFAPEMFAPLPAPAIALFFGAWGQLHGLVMLEVFGHTDFIGAAQPEVFDWTMRRLLADIRRTAGG